MPAGALERAVTLLDHLAQPDGEMTVARLAQSTGMPTSTAYRLLSELEHHGLVAHRAGARVSLGPRLVALGRDAESALRERIVEPAAPVMRQLSRQSGETVILTAPCGLETLVLHVVETDRHSVRLSYARYQRGPLHRGASAKVLAAWLPDHEQRRLLASVPDPEDLRQALQRIHRDGFSYTAGELDEGAAAVAAPILDQRRRLVAGITVAGPIDRLADRVDAVTSSVTQAAQVIEHALRGRA